MAVFLLGATFGGYQKQALWREPFLRDIADFYEMYESVYDYFVKAFGTMALNHSYEAVCLNINNIERYLVSGGWVCFDAAFSHCDGVNRAITDCVINSGKYELRQQMTKRNFMARRK